MMLLTHSLPQDPNDLFGSISLGSGCDQPNDQPIKERDTPDIPDDSMNQDSIGSPDGSTYKDFFQVSKTTHIIYRSHWFWIHKALGNSGDVDPFIPVDVAAL